MNHAFRRSAMPAVGLALATAVVAGCGSVQDRMTEAAVERAIGAEIDASADDDSVTVTTEDGSFSVTPDRLPDQWPSNVPVPSDHTVESALAVEQGGDLSITAGLMVDGTFDDVVAELESGFASAGWAAEEDPLVATMGDLQTWHVAYEQDGARATVSVRAAEDTVTVSYLIHVED